MKIYVPPLKCQGIKTKLVEWIYQYIELENTGTWIEPFLGSGVVGFNICPPKAIFCDINPHIINFYNAIKAEKITPQIARNFLESEGSILSQQGDKYYYQVRERFNQNSDPLDFLFLNRASFNGVIRFNKKGHYNVPFCRKRNRFTKAYITKIINQIDYVICQIHQHQWQFICKDFTSVIQSAKAGDFLYCDPPYIGRHTDYFNTWTEQNEDNLYQLLSDTPAKFILSTWHSNQYRDNHALKKYSNRFTLLTRQHFYHVGAQEKNRNPMIEAIIMNYNPIVVQASSL